MVETRQGLHGKVILTIKDSRGNVVLHETVHPDDVETISSKTLARIR
jgi:hypothetical protein